MIPHKRGKTTSAAPGIVAADSAISPIAIRLAVAIAALADDRGVVRAHMADLVPHCDSSVRRMRPHLDQLIAAGYLLPGSLTRQGRIAVTIAFPPDSTTIREARARLVSITELDPKFRLDLEIDDVIMSLTLDQRDARAIGRAVKPQTR